MNTWSFALNADVSALVAQYVQQSRAKNTLRAYAEDLQHFVAWGGCIPAKPEQIAEYLAHYAQSLSYATLERRLAGIHYAHTQQMLISPTRHPLVKAVLSGIRRQRRPPVVPQRIRWHSTSRRDAHPDGESSPQRRSTPPHRPAGRREHR